MESLDSPINLALQDSSSINELLYRCTTCEEKFAGVDSYKNHLMIHAEKRNFACSFCQVTLCTRSSLMSHIANEHTDHQKEIKKKVRKRHKCKLCAYSARAPNDLRKHMLVHTNEYNFSCTICEKKYRSKKSVRIHTLLHRKDQKFTCEYCQKEISTKCGLSIHKSYYHEDVSGTPNKNLIK